MGVNLERGRHMRMAELRLRHSQRSSLLVQQRPMCVPEYNNGAAPNAPTREYVYGDSDSGAQLLASVAGGTTQYFQQDHLSVRLITDSNGNDVGEEGDFPFGEAWYQSNSSSEWVFTSYQRDSESGLDYAVARFYNSRTGAFCSADPLEGRPSDPQSWNRYAYAENDPINLLDPSGKSILSDLLDALAILFEAFTGAPTGEIALGLENAISTISEFADFAYLAKQISKEGQGQQNAPPTTPPNPPGPPNVPGAPDNYTQCPPVPFTIKAPNPHQATTSGGAAGVPKEPGDVAYNPKDFGLSSGQAKQLDRASVKIFFQPDWSQAKIPTKDGGYAQPAPNRGMPQVPDGLPTQGPMEGTDTLGGVGRIGNPPNTIDTYGYPTDKQASRATRIVPVVVFIPKGSGATCPQAQ